jgi:hypothetical protein
MKGSIPRRHRWAALFLLGLTGCGLSEYEKKMDVQRKRVEEIDETLKLLDDPIDMPKSRKLGSKDELVPAWPFDVFLRLPKGFGTSAKEKDLLFYNNYPFLVRYTNDEPGCNIFVAAVLTAESKKTESSEQLSATTFRNIVKYMLTAFYTNTIVGPGGGNQKLYFSDETIVSAKKAGPAGDSISYKLTSAFAKNVKLEQRAEFLVYFHESAGKQICIAAYHSLDTPQEAAFKKSLDACLGTLDISKDAGSLRSQFMARKR